MASLSDTNELIALTGASGYIGSRMLDRLREKGFRIRCLSRNPQHLQHRIDENIEAAHGDAQDYESLTKALKGVHTAFYFIHSMAAEGDFEKLDRIAAENFSKAANECGVARIIYLGGIINKEEALSSHLKSRLEVGDILRNSGVQTIEMRASIVIGSGSISFEMVRSLVERLPVMITPRWVSVKAQPIAVNDLLEYLCASIDLPGADNKIIEVGGNDVVSYEGIMQEYARQRGLRRYMIKVPVLTPHLSSLWLGLVTPLYVRVGKHLIGSIRNPTVVQENSAKTLFSIHPMGIEEAIAAALRNEDHEYAQSRWSDSLSASGVVKENRVKKYGSRVFDKREIFVSVCPERAFYPVRTIGGNNGWYYANFLWKIRGYLDLIFGGIGMRRGRRDPEHLHTGDTLDWWRVETCEPDNLLRLKAEMKVPGRAWLQFEVEPKDGGSLIHQTAIFDPLGLWGLLYWYSLLPLHVIIFHGMLKRIARKAEAR